MRIASLQLFVSGECAEFRRGEVGQRMSVSTNCERSSMRSVHRVCEAVVRAKYGPIKTCGGVRCEVWHPITSPSVSVFVLGSLGESGGPISNVGEVNISAASQNAESRSPQSCRHSARLAVGPCHDPRLRLMTHEGSGTLRRPKSGMASTSKWLSATNEPESRRLSRHDKQPHHAHFCRITAGGMRR